MGMSLGVQEGLRNISAEAFAMLGAPSLAYVRPMATPEGPLYGIFAANGTQVGAAPSQELAMVLARRHDFEPVNVH